MELQEIDQNEVAERGARSLSALPRPFVRWAGSKRSLIPQIAPHLPGRIQTYFEPFLGGGALFLAVRPDRAVLNDSCPELVQTWTAVATDPNGVYAAATAHRLEKDTYYKIRASRSDDPIQRAGEFLYLNRGCFNGLYRVNSQGGFNVPWGAPRTEFVVDRENLVAVSRLLENTDYALTTADFDVALKRAARDDLVFLDPPYVTRHNNNGFVDYNERLFSWTDQQRLAVAAESARRRGAFVIVANADHGEVRALYPTFRSHVLERSTTLASNAARRGRTTESLLIGKPDHG